MLRLDNITKIYVSGDNSVRALNGVSVSFRKSEFVSVLGPSGCGKTTLLNIIGGLDHYTEGDLIIDGVSTKEYGDRDWDTYRNHRIGFVFQSYNLIPHQTILENVELALTISGISRQERIVRAKAALDKVGLSGLYGKKPNQLSGGQCQRVAIARALVGDPEILLADEPTGALDTVTSEQIMDLVKEIAKERLVIMVTHNPQLAEQYSTRIIKLLDGCIVDDTDPYDEALSEENAVSEAPAVEAATEPDGKKGKVKRAKDKKSKLSFWTAFRLSARNLRSKFKRTLLVCIAGSIGIIGIASVLSISTGITNFTNDMQNDMLSGNPISIKETDIDINKLMSFSDASERKNALKGSVTDGYVNVDFLIEYLAKHSDDLGSLIINNDISQLYIDYIKMMPKDYYSSLDFNYGLNLSNNIYADYGFTDHEGEKISLALAQQIYTSILEQTSLAEYTPYISFMTEEFKQAPEEADFILSQYEIISSAANSKIATKENEIMLVVGEETELKDFLLAQFGYYSQEEFLNIVYKASDDERYDSSLDKDKFGYDELLGRKFTWYPNNTVYTPNSNSFTSTMNPFFYNPVAAEDWEGGMDLTITAILRPKAGLAYGCLKDGFYYTAALAKKIIKNSMNSQIVRYLKDNEKDSYLSAKVNDLNTGITYKYSFTFDGTEYEDMIGFVGSASQISQIASQVQGMGGMDIPDYYTLSLRALGGCELPEIINIYPKDFERKDDVTAYLDKWNSDEDIILGNATISAANRKSIVYTDTLALVIGIINSLIKTITAALVAFTALSLVVSTVMIAIITYVSVIERIKEIGVIRSLGGRKIDVSNLFNAETFIIGGLSGAIGIFITYLITVVINLITKNLLGIGNMALLTAPIAFIMIAISIGLTLVSGLIPASIAAKKDPVEALRTE